MKFIVCQPQGDTGNVQKICITGHIDDFDMFRVIMDDILNCRDCNIYVSMEERGEESMEERKAILREMDLLVCLVTGKFLLDPDCLGRKDMSCANKNKIPVLPIMITPGLEVPFNHICGDIHLLNRNSDGYMNALRERINEISMDADAGLFLQTMGAFSGEIFLSYRKRNYAHASNLIQRLHQIESCQDVSIWYDDFLGLGEDYSEEIENRIKFCDIFLLMMTPNLLDEPNYVLDIEFPLAKELGKKILAIEVVPTDLKIFKEKFVGAPEPLKLHELDKFEKILLDNKTLWNKKSYIEEIDHGYFLGMAYCYGMHVEKNKTLGIELLEKAVELGSIKAISRMIYLYSIGEDVQKDYDKVLALRAKVDKYLESLEQVSFEDAAFLGRILRDECDVHLIRLELEKAEKVLDKWRHVIVRGEDVSCGRTAIHIRYGHLFLERKEYQRAERAFQLAEEDLEIYDWLPEKQVVWSLRAQIYIFRGRLYKELYRDISTKNFLYKAIEAFQNAVEIVAKLERTFVDKSYDVKGIEGLLNSVCEKRVEVDLWVEKLKRERAQLWDLYSACAADDLKWQEYLSDYIVHSFLIASDYKERKQFQEAAPYYEEVCKYTKDPAMQGVMQAGVMYAFSCVGLSRVALDEETKQTLLQRASAVYQYFYEKWPDEEVLSELIWEINEELKKLLNAKKK